MVFNAPLWAGKSLSWQQFSFMGQVEHRRGSFGKAARWYKKALAQARLAQDTTGVFATLTLLGNAHLDQQKFIKAMAHYNEALKMARSAGTRDWEGVTLNNIGDTYNNSGQPQLAIDFFEQAQSLMGVIDNPRRLASLLNNRGWAHEQLGQFATAQVCYEKGLRIRRNLKDREGEGKILNSLGVLSITRGHKEEARRHLGEALIIFRETGYRAGEQTIEQNLRRLE